MNRWWVTCLLLIAYPIPSFASNLILMVERTHLCGYSFGKIEGFYPLHWSICRRFRVESSLALFFYLLESSILGKSLVKANLVEDFSMFFLDVLSSVKRYTRKARGFYLSIWLALPSYEVLHNSGTLPQHRAKLGHRRLDKYLQLSK